MRSFLNKLRCALAAALVLLSADGARTGEIVLRSRSAPDSAIVRLGDVADTTIADDAVAARLADAPLMPAPAPGTNQTLTAAQVRDLLAASGVDMAGLRLSGADAVVVEGPNRSITLATATVSTPRELSRDEATAAVVAEITDYLRLQTGHDLWEVAVEPNAALVDAYRRNESRPVLAGGKAPWTGRQRFTFSWGYDSRTLAATAQVGCLQLVAAALRTIERGDLVRATDVVLRPAGGSVPRQAVASLDAVVGKEAVQAIRAGAIIQTSQVRAPIVVRRGERVSVRASAAGVVVRTYATAQQDGSLGDLIMIQALESRERYAARVSGVRELEVFAAGTAARDLAAPPR